MVGWHPWLNGNEFEKTQGYSEGQGMLSWHAEVHGVAKSWTQPHPQGGISTVKKNHKLPAYERLHQTQQSKQDEKAERYSAGKGTW